MSKHPELEALLEQARRAPPLTDAELFEQKVSWIYGEMLLAGHGVTKDEVRANLRRLAPLSQDQPGK